MMNNKVVEILFDALSEGAGIQHLIDIARTEIFDNPVMVTNSSFRIVGLSSDVEFEDAVWNDAVRMHGFSKEIIDRFRRDEESDKLFRERKAFIYSTGLGKDIPRILAPLKSSESISGYLIIFAVKHPLESQDVQNAEILAKALNILMNGPITVSDVNLDLMDYTLKLLLSGMPADSSQIKALEKARYYVTYAVSLPRGRKEKQYIFYLEERIIQKSRKIYCFPYNKNLFVLINYDSPEELNRITRRLEKILEEYNLYAGASNHFEKIVKLQLYFEQAVYIKTFGRKIDPQKRLYRFKDYYIYFFISSIPENMYETLLCTDYQALRDYDYTHSLQLVETLLSYYYNSMNINQVSEELHVHRNTISYRLNLVKDKLQIDYTDIRRLRNIVLSSEIYNWNHAK